MKKKLILVLVTSLLMIAGMGAFLWRMNSLSDRMSEADQKILNEEKDLKEFQNGKLINQVNELDIIPLYISGDKKNVVTMNYTSAKDVYDTGKSAKVEETLSEIKKRSDTYLPKTALWAYNPYGTNDCGLYVYFKTSGKCYCRYTVSVKEDNIPDFTRTLLNDSSGNITTEHEYQVIGLVPGKKNYVTLRLYNKKGQLSESVTYSIDMPESRVGAQTVIDSTAGRSKTVISNGLYTVFGEGKSKIVKETKIVTRKVKSAGKQTTRRIRKTIKKKVRDNAILLYDNSGVLRGEIPLDGYVGRSIQSVYDGVLYSAAKDKIVLVNKLGQVLKVCKINGYNQSGEFAYDDFGSVYVIATPVGRKSVKNSVILKIELDNGEVSKSLDMKEVLPEVWEKAKKQTGNQNPDWIDVNSIQVTGTNQLLISSGKLSSIFKVSNAGSLMPKINYIISDKSIWKDYKGLKKKVLTKALKEGETPKPVETPIVNSILKKKKTKAPELFDSQAGQNVIRYEKSSELAEGQYYISMLNNNSGLMATKESKSRYYKYMVDENTKTYSLVENKAFDKNSNGGNILKLEDVFVYCKTGTKNIIEMDSSCKDIKQFKFKNKIYRTYKNDWKGFWFY